MIRFDLFPGGKKCALTMSYDDGRDHDRRLIEIFNEYGVRGTFHLNSGKLGTEGYVTPQEIKTLYAGHEVSCHTVTHPFLEQLPVGEAVCEIQQDRKNLEALVGYPVRGMSYPFGTWNQAVLDALPALGIEYSRTTVSTHRTNLPDNFLLWHPTCHHNDAFLDEPIRYFPSPWGMSLLYIWGHSYEFADRDNWDRMEKICKTYGRREDCWYATNLEIVDYMQALRALRFSADRHLVYNPTALSLCFSVDQKAVCILPGQTLEV